ncbi:MAG: hypothetical protein K2X03_02960 [Bryobacteraceae bacterium]|nr:hypothetical protein [Bryobacteraceae bacterium]
MTVEAQEPEISEPVPYPTGGAVSAMTLIEDVRAIRQRLDGVEVALRSLSQQMENPAASGNPAPAAGSVEELRKALLGDLQADLRRSAKRTNLLMLTMLIAILAGLGGVAWMIRQIE